jgi:hypothetical protein
VLLRRKGRFFPFGAVVWAGSGELQLAAAPAERGTPKDPGALLDALVAELTEDARAGKIRAAATCGDLRADPELGAVIRVDVETEGGDARCVLQPYRKLFPRRFLLHADPLERAGIARGIFPLTR